MGSPEEPAEGVERTLHWVKRYCDLGWAVIPVWPIVNGFCSCYKGAECHSKPGKHPIPNGWQKHATSNYELSKNWWREHPEAGVAIVAGKVSGGLVIVDVDGPVGLATLAGWEAEHGKLEAPMQVTGGGGRHYLFKSDKVFRNKTKKVPGIDVRAEGGCIIAAPSMHLSGKEYQWESLGPAVELPGWLEGVLEGKTRSDFDLDRWLRRTAPTATLHDAGSDSALFTACETIRCTGMRDVEVFLEAVEKSGWNARCEPPWSEEELRHKFASALTKVLAEGLVDVKRNKEGKPESTLDNFEHILADDAMYRGKIRLNEITGAILLNDKSAIDADVGRLKLEICRRYGIGKIHGDDFYEVFKMVADDNKFNPLNTYLNSLEWDGVSRLEDVATKGLGTDRSIDKAYARRWFVGAVARAMAPGCKFDTCWILIGPQGIGKSTFFKTLAGKEYFKDTRMDLDSKDRFQQVAGAWVYELPELETIFRKKEVGKVKDFLSSTEDFSRDPYAHLPTCRQRRTVIVGSTNESAILRDPTGDRRYWVTKTNKIDREWVEKVRDQLWAEAMMLWRAGEQTFLTPDEEVLRAKSNEEHQDLSPLTEEAMVVIKGLMGDVAFDGWLPTKAVYLRLGLSTTNVNRQVRDDINHAFMKLEFKSHRTPAANGWKVAKKPG